MKKMIILAIVFLVSSFLSYKVALATNLGDLDDSLRISTNTGCVRPILISSDKNKINIYITGEMVASATVLSKGSGPNKKETLFFEGGLYFDFKDEEVRKNVVEKIKKMINTAIENLRLHKETGKDIPDIKTAESYFIGSFLRIYQNGYSFRGNLSGDEPIDNFRFLAMRIIANVPISIENWSYDVPKSQLNIERRYFHSGKPIKMCEATPLLTIIDPGFSKSSRKGDGKIIDNDFQDQYILNDPNIPQDTLIFYQEIINSIVSHILKTRDTFDIKKFP